MHIRIDTDRGALFGPNFSETLDYFFGETNDVWWDCHRLTAGYSSSRVIETTAIRVRHNGGMVVAARVAASRVVSAVPPDAARCLDGRFASGTTWCPQLPRWVYEWAQLLLM
ncbi:hypothetical protein E5720_17510 [Rhodococcus sp. PAMC28707]|uniref:hypothetical protein n=1 Tax=unclassified Rhodococcus (in: high G+C Gram-positive bacteria) TaxID=192944 RepID=UPI00109DF0A4|nr:MULTISPECIES: hypothetical protein [unclassified Rhodococcus (in: high G+C Gram-positive bacteria)]QCB51815.1 hypothetical protein E5769_18010 [Rhodococcus sp. PAMC28705]QCB60016.1 hypothetical protein E5720_17510 [Rhodococcus sp. PAMC28707]